MIIQYQSSGSTTYFSHFHLHSLVLRPYSTTTINPTMYLASVLRNPSPIPSFLFSSLVFFLFFSAFMASNYYTSLIGAMDRLWFHQIILLSQPISLIPQQNLETPQLIITESFKSPSPSQSISSLEDEKYEEISTDFSPITDEANSSDSPPKTPQDDDDEEELISKKERLKRSSFAGARIIRWHSSSPSTEKGAEHLIRRSGGTTRLEKSMSCKSLGELELKELKGFMDLGFIFKKEHISPRMMSLLPGLQRLKVYKNKEINGSSDQLVKANEIEEEEEEEEEERDVIRPYLSEAWLIKRPGSPLLNLKVPRVSAAADMKKHLRFWARTVASEIQQES